MPYGTTPPRTLTAELMDAPGLDPGEHAHALRGLGRLNAASLADRPIWLAMRGYSRGVAPLRVLDVATGGGDVPARLQARAKRAGPAIDWHLCDVSPCALEVAKARLASVGAAAQCFVHDIVKAPPPGRYDVVLCSLFLHHLSWEDATAAVRHMAGVANHLIISDLRRTGYGVALAALASRALSRSPIVHTDAVRSAHAAWTIGEASAIAQAAGLPGAHIRRVWPSRWILVWGRQ